MHPETSVLRHQFRRALALLVAKALMPGASAAENAPPVSPWATMAETDLIAAHDLLKENHPGAIDPAGGQFAERLESGLVEALALARQARNFPEYKQSLQRYMNQFQDDHVHILFNLDYRRTEWPGFIVAADDPELGVVSVHYSEIAELPVGTRIRSCDGLDVQDLLVRNVFRFRTNVQIPHARLADVPQLFVDEGNAFELRPGTCKFERGGIAFERPLQWQSVKRDVLRSRIEEVLGRETPPLKLERVGDGFLLSIPSFDWWGSDAARMQSLLDELARRAAEICTSKWLVIDVRGNGGGNSVWGALVLSTLWSQEWLEYADSRLDHSAAWRASEGNIAELRKIIAATEQAFGDPAAAEYWQSALEGMERARTAGQPFHETQDTRKPTPLPARNPMRAKVYFLTDDRCASACLNFADALLKLPRVVHVGLPTAADTPYIDVRDVQLPSGNGRLFIAMKVYRNYARAANQWYEPVHRWPGGPMTEQSVIAWIERLHGQRARIN